MPNEVIMTTVQRRKFTFFVFQSQPEWPLGLPFPVSTIRFFSFLQIQKEDFKSHEWRIIKIRPTQSYRVKKSLLNPHDRFLMRFFRFINTSFENLFKKNRRRQSAPGLINKFCLFGMLCAALTSHSSRATLDFALVVLPDRSIKT